MISIPSSEATILTVPQRGDRGGARRLLTPECPPALFDVVGTHEQTGHTGAPQRYYMNYDTIEESEAQERVNER